MSKILYYLFWLVVYLGICLLCDVIFEDKFTGTYYETAIRAIKSLIAVVFVNISEKKGWNSWGKVIAFFRHKK